MGDMTKGGEYGGGGGSLKTLNWMRKQEKPQCASSPFLLPSTYQTPAFVQTTFLFSANKTCKKVDIVKYNLQLLVLGNLKIKSSSSISKESLCGTSGRSDIRQNWRSGTVTLHALACELKLVQSWVCKNWDLTVVLGVESRSSCLLPQQGRKEVPLNWQRYQI